MNPCTAIGGPAAVTTSDIFSNEAAASVLRRGGSAVDAMVAAAAVQCVVSHGAVTVAGMWISNSYDPSTRNITTVDSKISAPDGEPYDYDMQGLEAWGGRGMPVPGWVSGAFHAWKNGGRLPWSALFEHAIALADAYPCDEATRWRVRPGLSMPLAAKTEEGRAIWMSGGRYIKVGEPVRQPALARTLRALAAEGPEAFYEGEFAQSYVAISRSLGGRLTLADMATAKDRATVRKAALMGDFCGHKIVTEGGLMVYALHLAQAADIGSLDEAEAVYAQFRIMEEVFHATGRYSPETHAEFIDRSYAESQIEEVLTGPVRPFGLEHFYSNTEVLVVRDADGGAAWVVHSINCPNAFGAGILAGGAYAVRVNSQRHGQTGDLLQPGLFVHLGLFRNGELHVASGSPGQGVMHGPIEFTMGLMQRKLDPYAALCAPRFGLASPATAGVTPFECHYPPAVFEMLQNRGVPHFACGPTTLTGRISAIVVEDDCVHSIQDIRGESGLATAFALE